MAERQIHVALPEIARGNQAARRQRFDGDLPRQAFVALNAVFDDDALHVGLEQFTHRQPPPTIGERDDDAIGA